MEAGHSPVLRLSVLKDIAVPRGFNLGKSGTEDDADDAKSKSAKKLCIEEKKRDDEPAKKYEEEERTEVEIPETLAQELVTISNMLEDLGQRCNEPAIPLFGGVSAPDIEFMIRFHERCQKEPVDYPFDDVAEQRTWKPPQWWHDMIQPLFVPGQPLRYYSLYLASNYLDYALLRTALTYHTSSRLMGKEPEQIRRDFGIVNDFTPEEMRKLREENYWIYSNPL